MGAIAIGIFATRSHGRKYVCWIVCMFDSDNLLDIESNSRNGGDDFAKLKLIENGSLSSSIKTNHKNTDLLLTHQAGKDL